MCNFFLFPAACSTTLDQVIDSQHDGLPKHLGLIADSLAEWEGPIADELNLTRADVVSIKLNHPQRFNLQMYVLLYVLLYV